LQRRLEGISITEDDFHDLDDADDLILEGMESYFEPADPEEIKYLEDLLYQFENTGEDSKLSHCITILRQELIQRESAIVFTQYTDTMDYLRTALQQLYGAQKFSERTNQNPIPRRNHQNFTLYRIRIRRAKFANLRCFN